MRGGVRKMYGVNQKNYYPYAPVIEYLNVFEVDGKIFNYFGLSKFFGR